MTKLGFFLFMAKKTIIFDTNTKVITYQNIGIWREIYEEICTLFLIVRLFWLIDYAGMEQKYTVNDP